MIVLNLAFRSYSYCIYAHEALLVHGADHIVHAVHPETTRRDHG